jgi:hypothetical protein
MIVRAVVVGALTFAACWALVVLLALGFDHPRVRWVMLDDPTPGRITYDSYLPCLRTSAWTLECFPTESRTTLSSEDDPSPVRGPVR